MNLYFELGILQVRHCYRKHMHCFIIRIQSIEALTILDKS